MSELSFEQMLEESLKTIRTGEVVTGKVIDVKEDEIVLNIGYKSDGIITRSEYTNESNVDLRNLVHVGDEMEAKVVKVNDGEGQVALSYKRLAADRGNKRLEEAFENHEVLTAKVSQVLDGGLSVIVDEARIFIPASLVSDVYEKDLSKYADKEIEFVITEFNPRRRRIIGNRKQLLLAEKAEKQKEIHERELKIMQHQIKKLTRQERTHRLIQRGAILEKFLIDPGALSEDQVMELVALAFSKPDIQVKLKKMISENNVTA